MEVKGGGAKEISIGVIRAIIACGDQETDRLRGVCLETLAELCMSFLTLSVDYPFLTEYDQ
jgi:hypothetical protein